MSIAARIALAYKKSLLLKHLCKFTETLKYKQQLLAFRCFSSNNPTLVF